MFGNGSTRNAAIFDVDNSSSSHTDNRTNEFLVLDERGTFGVTGSFGAPEKTFSINFNKAKTAFCLILHYNGDNSYFFLIMGKGKS